MKGVRNLAYNYNEADLEKAAKTHQSVYLRGDRFD